MIGEKRVGLNRIHQDQFVFIFSLKLRKIPAKAVNNSSNIYQLNFGFRLSIKYIIFYLTFFMIPKQSFYKFNINIY
ncbi:hypothetical protein HMPREF0204_13487 [Chryseobacterium gleum ATCC 35910]|uniref:Uncharacterized protein n=1 Tax=Chryseobacterium gleum ATCC 35910 TaxID=525257 RepID=A0ABP2ISS7_CHRGE|nr:hypothetical protein HMPREF0204_13487 [Chryseobacterium gleum ATCC 35910]